MECFRQIFRCLKAPFKRDKGRIIEIGPPTNFRKEELPAYFSDAESDAYVRGQPHSDRGEGRNNDRDAIATIVDEEQDAGPCSKNERETIRERVKLSRWWKSSPASDHKTKAPAESIKMEEMRNADLACS
ncbi:unnamed protein product [Penicillium roqueforti FM164]|uniref:Genomic scaffold, ProqFM164S02 n=1 Tax=Penicillium roqueforti (strain FM164) TaxID=1365484 RepID=W6Q3C6_PENRF|nr:unnamed protein product [Penicillium roqueforti FM164]